MLKALYFGVMIAISLSVISQHFPKTEQIESERKSDSSLERKKEAKPNPTATTMEAHKSTANSNHSEKEPPETYPLFGKSLKVTDSILAVLTFFLVIYTGLLYCMARKQDVATKTIERAYVKISHIPPGLRIFYEVHEGKNVVKGQIPLEVKNFGSTPSRITQIHAEIVIANKGEAPPKIPQYRGKNQSAFGGAFLVEQDSFTSPVDFVVDAERFKRVLSGDEVLHLIAHVDYIDAFEIHHRGGYARRYLPSDDISRNNLVFVELKNYNYDRQREHGEGDDWDT